MLVLDPAAMGMATRGKAKRKGRVGGAIVVCMLPSRDVEVAEEAEQAACNSRVGVRWR